MPYFDDDTESCWTRWIVGAVALFLALHIAAGMARGTYPPQDRAVLSSPVVTTSTAEPASPPAAASTVTSASLPNVAPVTSSTTQHVEQEPFESVPPVTTGAAQTWTWDDMADCESGDWDANGVPIAGTARWDDQRGGYEGGLHFLNDTWRRAGGARSAQHAYLASREQQIEIAEDWLARTSLAQWPKCSKKIGAH